MAIIGTHMLLYTPEAEQVRAVLRDAFGLDHVDAGEGWLIFKLPPAEVGVHPAMTAGDTSHALSFMCDDIESTMADLATKGIEFAGPPSDQGFGIVAQMCCPAGSRCSSTSRATQRLCERPLGRIAVERLSV